MEQARRKLEDKKQRIAAKLPRLTDVIRGTVMPWYGVCKSSRCKCHRDKRYLHGPYYRVTYTKGGKAHHVYVAARDKEWVEVRVRNYKKIWQGIEAISAVNLGLLKVRDGHRGRRKR